MLGIENTAPVPEEPEERRARYLAHAVRKPLLERVVLPKEAFAALMAAPGTVPSFCRWFVEPALYVFGRRRVLAALVDRLRTGSDAERAGAVRAWYCAHCRSARTGLRRTSRAEAVIPPWTSVGTWWIHGWRNRCGSLPGAPIRRPVFGSC